MLNMSEKTDNFIFYITLILIIACLLNLDILIFTINAILIYVGISLLIATVAGIVEEIIIKINKITRDKGGFLFVFVGILAILTSPIYYPIIVLWNKLKIK